MKKVMVFGTFDIFHPGHKNFLKQARRQGDFLIVLVARDKTVRIFKKQETRNKEQERLKKLKSSRMADEVILGNFNDKYAVIKIYAPEVICLGYDQKFFTRGLRKKLDAFGLKNTKIIRLKPFKPEIYKSSILIAKETSKSQ
jgi:FAD synthetase